MSSPQDAAAGAGLASPRRPVRSWVVAHPEDVVDVFVYVVVLNLAVQYFPGVISETFTLSLLTALLLKVTLEVVIRVKAGPMALLRRATTPTARVLAGVLLWTVAAGSKFVVLFLVERAFSGSVQLGGFFSVALLVVALLVARGAVRQLLVPARTAT
jgi:hypothetical protein